MTASSVGQALVAFPDSTFDWSTFGKPGYWLSGASNFWNTPDFGTWRGEPVTIVSSWADTPECQPEQCSLFTYDEFNGALDQAMGGIFKPQGETWKEAAAGRYDARFKHAIDLIQQHREGKGPTFVRFAHEFNLGYQKWSVLPNEAQDFITTFRRISGMLRAAGLKVVWAPNHNTLDGAAPIAATWPGDEYVDVVGIDTYDWGTPLERGTLEEPDGAEMWRRFAELHGKPLAFPEWGAHNQGAQDNPDYIRLQHAFVSQHAGTGAGQFIYDCYFNFTDSYFSVGLHPDSRVPNMAAVYQSLTWGYPDGAAAPSMDPAPPTPSMDPAPPAPSMDPAPPTPTPSTPPAPSMEPAPSTPPAPTQSPTRTPRRRSRTRWSWRQG